MSRPEHKPDGDPCAKCGLRSARHRKRSRDRAAFMRAYRASGKGKEGPRHIIGIDGEGYTTADGQHLYTYLAACDDTKLIAEARNPDGLTFPEVATFFFELPKSALIVGYSLGYDRAKWIETLSNAAIYMLLHPEERPGKFGPRPVRLACGYRINLVATKWSIKREDDGKTRTAWDLFKFFQCSFVKALRAWKVGTEAEVAGIERMKAKRGDFAAISREEEEYCQSECKLLAKLARALIEAHKEEDLELPSYYGPGSTASLILEKCGAQEECAKLETGPLALAVASAYFGGRFECSRIGPVAGPVYAYDIASAYPYALAMIPCMRHGTWEHWTRPNVIYDHLEALARARTEDLVVIRYALHPHPDACRAWGPLPHRLPTGDLLYPVQSAGGWAWSREALAALNLHPGIRPLEAYAWRRSCECPPPFREQVVSLFKRRLAWGKASRGIVLKLGLNSMYGKSAQSIGAPKYRCLVRAGFITSFARAMLLDMVARARDPWSVLELATDSVLSTEPLTPPPPKRLGSEYAAKKAAKSPLGAWEEKDDFARGVFLIRPGLRFALDDDAGVATTAARGIGTTVLHKNRMVIQRQWESAPMTDTRVQQPAFFHAAGASVRRVFASEPEPDGTVGWAYVRSENYARWEDPKPRLVSYKPGPKRENVEEGFRLSLWELPITGPQSTPYGVAPVSPGQASLDDLKVHLGEQPEYDMLDLV